MKVELRYEPQANIPREAKRYTFHIEGISRACLQELARHRVASLSVKSSRYTTAKDLKKENPFVDFQKTIKEPDGKFWRIDKEAVERANKYIVLTGDDFTDYQSIVMLELLRQNVKRGTSNDIAKYNMIESYKTELTWTIDFNGLKHFLELRDSKDALWEIRQLAQEIKAFFPSDWFEHTVIKENGTEQ